jgi:hypothetical protein
VGNETTVKEETEDRIQAGGRSIPIYSLRAVDQLGTLTRYLAVGQTAAFYVGFFGLLQGIVARAGPEAHSPIIVPRHGALAGAVLVLPPRRAIPLIATEQLHSDFRKPEDFVRLFTCICAPLQIIAPLRESFDARADPHAVEGTSCGIETQEYLPSAALLTAGFLWMHDLAWNAMAELLDLYSTPDTYYRLTSLPTSRDRPPFTLAELTRLPARNTPTPFDLIIHDPLFEQTGAFSAPTQVRLPLHEEEPSLVLLRQGGVSAEWLAEASGRPVRTASAARRVSRAQGLSDDDLRLRLDRPWQQW